MTAIIVIIVVLLLAAGGGYAYYEYYYKKQKKKAKKAKKKLDKAEQEIFKLAKKKGGRLSIPEIAKKTGLDAAAVEKMLDGMMQQGLVDLHVTDSGDILYEFLQT